jgi:hypothetical protein
MDITHGSSREHPVVHHVEVSQTMVWLQQGVKDLRRARPMPCFMAPFLS